MHRLGSWLLGKYGQAWVGHLAGNDCMCTALAVLDNLLQLPHDALPDQQQPCAAQHTPLSAAAKHACELLLTQQVHSWTSHGRVSYLLTTKPAGRLSHSMTVFTVQQCFGSTLLVVCHNKQTWQAPS